MRILIVTQAVDTENRPLGFFHRWIEAIAPSAEHVHVICLEAGKHALPENVSVHSLGKESGVSRLIYLARFYTYIWKYRREYDAVFVHMNQEYVLLGGIFWRLIGARVSLWRNHKEGSFWTRLAGWIAHTVFYTSPQAYAASLPRAERMPIGIDTGSFKQIGAPKERTILFFGRLDPVKRPEIFIEALDLLDAEGIDFTAEIVGDPTSGNEMYAHDVRNLAATLALTGKLSMRESIPIADAPLLYGRHAIYVNLTASGSFDKTIGEALASGCLVIAANDAVKDALYSGMYLDDVSPKAVAEALKRAFSLTLDQRERIGKEARGYIEREHSLTILVDRLLAVLRDD